MCEQRDRLDVDAMLRTGLREVATPEPSPGLCTRVLAQLHDPPSPWRALLGGLVPGLAGAAGAMALALVTLGGISFQPPAPRTADTARAGQPVRAILVDRLLDIESRPGALTIGNAWFIRPRLVHAPPAAPPQPTHKSGPESRLSMPEHKLLS